MKLMKSMSVQNTTSVVQMNKVGTVQVLVSNLEPSVGIFEWRRILLAHFHALIPTVNQVTVQRQSEGSCYAIVKLSSQEDAQLIILQLNQKKIGNRRIKVSIVSTNDAFAIEKHKKNVSKLLMSVPGHVLPVSTFIQLFEKKFHRSITLSELYRLRDIVKIKPSVGRRSDRVVSLIVTPDSKSPTQETTSFTEDPLCLKHKPKEPQICLQMLNQLFLPRVQISLGEFRQNTVKLLRNHDNKICLLSFTRCYESEFGEIMKLENSNFLENNAKKAFTKNTEQSANKDNVDIPGSSKSMQGNYVALEHLITCVPNVIIQNASDSHRNVVLQDPHLTQGHLDGNGQDPTPLTSITLGLPVGNPKSKPELQADSNAAIQQENIRQFRREVVEMLKQQPGCELLLSKFIPTYHNQFGKQCRVADYGFSKLQNLIDTLKGIVHVVGMGHLQTIMLTHGMQVRRFTHDLLRLLKGEAKKSCCLSQFPELYERVFQKEFKSSSYGVCHLIDLLNDILGTTIMLDTTVNDPMILIPKRTQTVEQQAHTRLFAIEVIEMLSNVQRFQIAFTKFIPAYHHAFNRQCRVSEYGFVKLIELLEALPKVVEVKEDNDKIITLTKFFRLELIKEMLFSILEIQPLKRFPIDELVPAFLTHYRLVLLPQDFEVLSLKELITSVPFVHIQSLPKESSRNSTSQLRNIGCRVTGDGPRLSEFDELVSSKLTNKPIDARQTTPLLCDYICLDDRTKIKQLVYKSLQILFNSPYGSLPQSEFIERFKNSFQEEVDMDCVEREMSPFIQIKEYAIPLINTSDASNRFLAEDCQHSWREMACDSTETGTIVCSNEMPNSSSTRSESLQSVCLVSFAPLITFARQLRTLLLRTRGRLMLSVLETMYRRHFGVPLCPDFYGYPSLQTLVGAVSFVAILRGRGTRATLFLSQDYMGKLAWIITYKILFRHDLLWTNVKDNATQDGCFSQVNPSLNLTTAFGQIYNPTCSTGVGDLSESLWDFNQTQHSLPSSHPIQCTLKQSNDLTDYLTNDQIEMQNYASAYCLPSTTLSLSIPSTPNPSFMIGLATPELNFCQPNCYENTNFKPVTKDLISCSTMLPQIKNITNGFVSNQFDLQPTPNFDVANENGYYLQNYWPNYEQTLQESNVLAFSKPQLSNTSLGFECYSSPFCYKTFPMIQNDYVTTIINKPSVRYPFQDSNSYEVMKGVEQIENKNVFNQYDQFQPAYSMEQISQFHTFGDPISYQNPKHQLLNYNLNYLPQQITNIQELQTWSNANYPSYLLQNTNAVPVGNLLDTNKFCPALNQWQAQMNVDLKIPTDTSPWSLNQEGKDNVIINNSLHSNTPPDFHRHQQIDTNELNGNSVVLYNRCEEGDWTLPISMTTESFDSNSKELDETGSFD